MHVFGQWMVKTGAGSELLKWQRGNWDCHCMASGHSTFVKDVHFMKMHIHFITETLYLKDISQSQ